MLVPKCDRCRRISNDLQKAKFNVTDKDNLSDYLGVKIKKLPEGNFKLSQPHLINSMLEDLGLNLPSTIANPTPALLSKVISHNLNGPAFNKCWEYQSVIGKLNFLEKSTRLDIGYASHQCAHFSIAPRESHAIAVKRIGEVPDGYERQRSYLGSTGLFLRSFCRCKP
jgi:hypothetical protein